MKIFGKKRMYNKIYEINNEVVNSLKKYEDTEEKFHNELKKNIDSTDNEVLKYYLDNTYSFSKKNKKISMIDSFIKDKMNYYNSNIREQLFNLTNMFDENLQFELNEIGKKSLENSINILSTNNAFINNEMVRIMKNMKSSSRSIDIRSNNKAFNIQLPNQIENVNSHEVKYANH